MCSKIREKPLVNDIGLYLNTLCLLPFLWTGIIKDIFHCFGTSANSIEQLKINVSGKVIDGIACLIK